MKLNPRLPKGKAKIILGSLFISTLVTAFLFFYFSKAQVRPRSTLNLTFQDNQFNFVINLATHDQENADNLINQLNLPKDIFKGFQFSLDSTSSAKLAFSTPIKANINLSDHEMLFDGQTSQPPANFRFKPKNFKIPHNVLLNVFGSNLHTFLLSRLNIPTETISWLNAGFQKDSPEYFLIFNNSDMALLWQNSQIDFSVLKNISANDTSYKEENEENITYYLYKLPKNKEGQEITLAFFKINDYTIIATSPNSAKEIAKAAQSKDSGANFIEDTAETSFYMDYKNPQKKLDPNLKAVFFNDSGQSVPKEKIFETLEKTSRFKFTLKADSFSGLINW